MVGRVGGALVLFTTDGGSCWWNLVMFTNDGGSCWWSSSVVHY